MASRKRVSTTTGPSTGSPNGARSRSGRPTRPHSDAINPPHYTRLSPEPLDVIEAWGLGFHLGNVLKYIARAGHKGDEVTDLRKAVNYLKRRIAMLSTPSTPEQPTVSEP